MKTRLGPALATAAALALLLTLGACQKESPSSGTASRVGPAPTAPAATATAGGAPEYFTKEMYVCDARKSHHVQGQKKPYFKIAEIGNGSGLYVLDQQKPEQWDKGWRSLVLTVVGSEPVNMPASSWAETTCRPGSDQGDGTEPNANTIRLRGGVCLPDGEADHILGTCDNDVVDENDDTKSIYHYHEIVVFAREAMDHMIIQHCSRKELEANGNVACVPFSKLSAPAEARHAMTAPHPGHLHIEP
jgi:hypothetical protein